MGQVIEWQYELTVIPTGHMTVVQLHRAQVGTRSRFLWLQTSLPSGLQQATQDQVLQELYTACVALMELTVE